MKTARLVFDGVVKALKSSTSKESMRDNAIVVTVEDVVRAPEVLTDSAGSNITVWLAEREKVAKGERARFYTNPAHWGESVAVQSVGHTAPEAVSGSRRGAAAPVQSLAQQRLQEHVANADVVVSGTVSAVRLPEEKAANVRRSAMAAESNVPQRISEHDPIWREAVIEVHDTHKGRAGRQVVVRFPKSNDVRWRSSPKFQTGQQGVFLLHQEELAGGAPVAEQAVRRGAAVGPPAKVTYMAPASADFQPLDREEDIKTLIRAGKK
jgi:hypothetical protein